MQVMALTAAAAARLAPRTRPPLLLAAVAAAAAACPRAGSGLRALCRDSCRRRSGTGARR